MSLLLSTGAFASSLSGAAPGMVLMKPTSITHSGTSASLGANGQVTFSAVTSLSLNGCFTADFDNYVVSMRSKADSSRTIRQRYRVSGSDNSTANSYVDQYLLANGSTVEGLRTTGDFGVPLASYTREGGVYWCIYGPALAQPTASRTISGYGFTDAFIADYASTHNQSTSYDGFTIYPAAGNITGALQVYGVRS